MDNLLDPPSPEEENDLLKNETELKDNFFRQFRRRVLLIDDTESVLNDYERILRPEPEDDLLGEMEDFLFDDEDESDGKTEKGEANQEYEFELAFAPQGEDGYNLAKDARDKGEPFQLAFVDMRMPPGWDGLQTIQAIMRIDPDMHFVISTAYSDFTWAETMDKIGQADSDRVLILKKPFDTSEVWQMAVALTEKWFLKQTAKIRETELAELVKVRTSELLKTQDSLVEARNQAIEASEAKSRFLAGMSHEIRTPLNAVIGLAETLQSLELSEEAVEMVTTLNSSTDHLLNMINDILEFSKIEAGKMELESIRFDLQTCINDVIQLFGRKAHEKGIGLWFSYPFWVPTRVVGDPTRFKQILTNLVSNAVKFTDEGQVYVSVNFSEGKDKEKLFTITVDDSGPGISEDSQKNLFSEYRQADSSTARQFGGTGLGLQISRRLATLMGGNIQVESTIGKGSQFRVTLPFSEATDPENQNMRINTSEMETRDFHVIDLRGDSVHLVDCMRNYAGGVFVYSSVQEYAEKADVHELDIAVINVDELTEQVKELCGEMDREKRCSIAKIIISHTYRNPTADEARPFNIRGHMTMPVDVYEFVYALTLICREREFHADTPVITRQLVRMRRQIPSTDERYVVEELSGHVLLVEDNVVNQRVTKMILKRMGITADVAGDGAEAIEMLRSGEYDLALMDCNMPVMDGFDATRKIREYDLKNRQGRAIPIIAMTACVIDEEIKNCYDAGMNDYLPKPAKPSAISIALKRWLNERSTEGGVRG
ncbi:MAG: response regulator [Opitutales bacterium]|nr:response regulator [Opitutales bacterium]NRA25791.1 response regulator [Opitutales bacterium]